LTVAISHGELTKLGWLQRTCATHAFRKLKSLSGGSMLTFRKIALISTLALAPLTSAWADPPLDPSRPSSLFCISVTGAQHIGKGVELQFETLNWTDVPANDLTYNLIPLVYDGRAGSKKGNINTWVVSPTPITPTVARWEATARSLPNVDVWVNADDTDRFEKGPETNFPGGKFLSDEDVKTKSKEFKINELDGFRVIFPEFEVGERIVFEWALSAGDPIPDKQSNGGARGYNKGLVQLDRADDGPAGEIRLTWKVSPGLLFSDLTPPFPDVDLNSTNINAVTIPSIPEPSTLLLALSALALPLVRKMRQPS